MDESVLRKLEKMNHPRQAILEARTLKDNGNLLFKSKEYARAIDWYERALQFMCVGEPLCKQDADLMSDLGVTLNPNLVACWLKLNEFETARLGCDLALRFDAYNVKARNRRALACIGLGFIEDARTDLEIALKFEPKNNFVSKELRQLEEKLGFRKDRDGVKEGSSSLGMAKEVFNPLCIQDHSTYTSVPCLEASSSKDPTLNLSQDLRMKDVTEFEREDNKASEGKKKPQYGEMSILDHNSEGHHNMDVDNQDTLFAFSEEISIEHPNRTAGTSPTAEAITTMVIEPNPDQSSETTDETELITFSNVRCPNYHIRISRKAYSKLVGGRQLSFIQASRHDRLSVRVLTRSRQISPMEVNHEKAPIVSKEVSGGKADSEETVSTITSECSSNNMGSAECEIMESSSIDSCNMDSQVMNEVLSSPVSIVEDVPRPFYFTTLSKNRGRKGRHIKGCSLHSKSRGCHNMHKITSLQGKVSNRIHKCRCVYLCRNQRIIDKERNRNNAYDDEDIVNKKRIVITSKPDGGLYGMTTFRVIKRCCEEVSAISTVSVSWSCNKN